MDRRNFIKSLLASGVLGSSPLAARAASELFASGTAQPVTIIGQSGLPHAADLVAGLKQVLASAGIEHHHAEAAGIELIEYSQVAALLDRVPGRRLIGVMDDAAALIFQELAMARGAACVVATHHRFGGAQVRHCCSPAGQADGMVWSDRLPDHAGRIGRLYAGALGAADPGGSGATATAIPDDAPASLVSFLITL